VLGCAHVPPCAAPQILCGNPDLYADIQLQNPEVPATLRNLAQGMLQLADTVQAGDRTALIDNYFTKPRESLGTELLSDGNTDFERLSHLLADLDEPHPLVLTIVQDSPGTLSTVLAEFASNGVNLRSIQSVRAKDGSVRFHLCLDRPAEDPAVTKIGDELSKKGLIKLWDSSM
jgi:prephenate dehydrogenase